MMQVERLLAGPRLQPVIGAVRVERQLCSVSIMLATITWSSTCAFTVSFSIGAAISTRRSKLRGIQSAELM